LPQGYGLSRVMNRTIEHDGSRGHDYSGARPYPGHPVTGRQIGMSLISCHLPGIVPLGTHEMVPVAGIAEAGMEFRPGVSSCPLRKFLVNYDCLLPLWHYLLSLWQPQILVKVAPKRVCFSTNPNCGQ
jgi:hypothetical protein